MSARERDEPEPDQGAGTEPPARDPHPSEDPEAGQWEAPERDRLDE